MTTELEDRIRQLEERLKAAEGRADTTAHNQPVPPKTPQTTTITPTVPQAKQRKQRQTSTKRIALLLIISILAIGAASVTYWAYTHRSSNPLLSYAKQIPFPLYYPQPLPSGYSLEPNSLHISPELITYTLKSDIGKPAVTISLQPAPDTFDASTIIGQTPIPALGVPIGSSYDISVGDVSKYFITTGKGTLIFMNSDSGRVSSDVMNSIAKNMVLVK